VIDRLKWVCLAVLLLAAPASLHAQAVGDVIAPVSVTDLDGRPVRLAVTPGRKAMVIEFWATWCEVCDALLPRMREASARYGSRVDFYGVNVTVNESKPRVRRFVAEHKLPFRTLYDARGVAVRAYAAPATSHVVIVDAAGKIRYVGTGADQDIAGELAKVVGG
jgi:cytochrome c biogenesis protein CcmG/thiol:disulfide interchange protein DsbE